MRVAAESCGVQTSSFNHAGRLDYCHALIADCVSASRPCAYRLRLIPVIPFYVEIQQIRETIETVPEDGISL